MGDSDSLRETEARRVFEYVQPENDARHLFQTAGEP